ncbi:MAG: MATE family efflux transporter [Opitutales bacterium]
MARFTQEIRPTLKLALPMIIGQVGIHLIVVIDTAMIGRVGVVELAAAAFANNFVGPFMMFGFGLVSACSVLVAQAFGRSDAAGARTVVYLGLLLIGLYSVGLGVSMYGIKEAAHWLNQPPEVLEACWDYLILINWSNVPMLLFSCLKAYSEALNRPWYPLPFLGLALVLNVFFNWLLIFGNGGFPALGLEGAGWATLLSRLIALGALSVAMSRFGPFYLRWRPASFRTDFRKVKTYLKLGVPTGFQILFEVTAFNLTTIMMGWVGTLTLAAHAIALNYAALTFMVPLALSFAVSIRVGQAAGQGDREKIRNIGKASTAVTVLFMGLAGLCFVVFRHQLPWLMLSPGQEDVAAVIALASVFLVVGAVFQIVDGLQVVMIGALRGLQDVTIPTISVFVVYWLICLPVGYLLGFPLGLGGLGIWYALAGGLALNALAMTGRFWYVAGRPLKVGL